VLRRGGAAVGLATVRPRVMVAAAALGCVLAVGWVTDFRYLTQRTTNGHWRNVAVKWLNTCEHSRTGTITVPAWVTGKVTLSCSSLRR